MEEFTIGGLIGTMIGTLIGFLLIVIIAIAQEPKVQKSGQYVTYENVIYKQVPQEELDNIIILEVK